MVTDGVWNGEYEGRIWVIIDGFGMSGLGQKSGGKLYIMSLLSSI